MEKFDYFIQDDGKQRYDITICVSDCQANCARKRVTDGFFTCANFDENCKSYKGEK